MGACAFGLVQAWLTIVNERKRTQPIVLAEGSREDIDVGEGKWLRHVRVRNDGAGPAFNVRFGIRLKCGSYAYRIEEADPPSGNRIRVLRPGSISPPEGRPAFPILLVANSSSASSPDESSMLYWCRYENATGKTWETRNPATRSADLDIRRIRWSWWRHWRDSAKQTREWRAGSFSEIGEAIEREHQRRAEAARVLKEERERQDAETFARANERLRLLRTSTLGPDAPTVVLIRKQQGTQLETIVAALRDDPSVEVLGPTSAGELFVRYRNGDPTEIKGRLRAALNDIDPDWTEYLSSPAPWN